MAVKASNNHQSTWRYITHGCDKSQIVTNQHGVTSRVAVKTSNNHQSSRRYITNHNDVTSRMAVKASNTTLSIQIFNSGEQSCCVLLDYDNLRFGWRGATFR
jgi:hypothetical protein